MDIFKSPWKTLGINDPIVSLSNSQRCEKKETLVDRYCLDGLCKNLFHAENNGKNQDSQQIAQPTINNQKNKNYRGLLVKTCSSQSDKKSKNTQSLGYCSKLNRPGYLLCQQVTQVQQIINKPRNLPKQPYRILNAPKLKDDFYTNLLDWSSEDLVSVVLDNAVYIWNSKQNETQKLVQGFVSSIKWGKNLILGEQTGKMRTIDVVKQKQLSRIRNHNGRIGTLDTQNNLIASGSKDGHVLVWDVRSMEITHRFEAHKQQVCGVKWSFDGNMIASGGNDNIVALWDVRSGKNWCKFNQHTAAVKALAWSPHQSYILSSGGGSTDKSIRVWNINQTKCIKRIDTGSQVCNMIYSSNSNQLVSTHGFSMNAINIWNAKNMEKIGTLRGHSYRVLYLAMSPDGQSILTGSGDQTLRFWKLFPNSASIYSRISNLQAKNTHLR